MKGRILPVFLCLVLTLSLVPGGALAAGEDIEVLVSGNENDNMYDIYSAAITSHLYQEGDELVRVEYAAGSLVVERYSENFDPLSSRRIDLKPHDLWGGFFAGEDYNFVITGNRNWEENDRAEVITVTKYGKDWETLGQAVLNGANTVLPFSYGSLRCAEYEGVLYIHTCHQMDTSSDGLNHQANLTMAVSQKDMQILSARYHVYNNDYGYVSHSFNQYILIDQEGNIVTLDHGDAYPRSAFLQRYQGKAGSKGLPMYASGVDIQTFPGQIGNNTTGGSLGGLAETSTGYITAYSYNASGGTYSSGRNIYLSYTPKKQFTENATTVVQLTGDDGSELSGTPVLVPMGPDGGYVLWITQKVKQGSGYTYYTKAAISCAEYAADGTVSDVTTFPGSLSDCQPIVYQGKAVWYVTENSTPTFYSLDSSGLTRTRVMADFQDVDRGKWYYDGVTFAYRNRLMDGSDTLFRADANASRADIVTALYQLDASTEADSSGFHDVYDKKLDAAVAWASSRGIVTGYGDGRFGPGDSVTREQFAAILFRYAQYKGYDTSARRDLSGYTDSGQISAYAREAMAWANGEGLITGVTETTLSPQGTCTRAQTATILMRFCS